MSAPQLPGITPLPATLKAAANSALSRGWMDTEEKGSGQQQKQVAKGKEFAFKIYLAYDPPSPPSRPFTLNASIFFWLGLGWATQGRMFGRGWTMGACHYTYINNLTASSAFEGQAWQLHNSWSCSLPPTRMAFLSEQHRQCIKTSHGREVLT